jgi:starvation-inducible DNA-binding protein
MSCESKLQNLITDNFAVAYKAQNHHFNVVGENFYQYHQLFGAVYETLYDWHDKLAEQLRQMDKPVKSGLKFLIDNSTIEDNSDVSSAASMVSDLSSNLASLLAYAGTLYNEAGAESKGALETLVGDYMTDVSKHLWMLRSTNK